MTEQAAPRKVFSRGEWLTLAGMGISVLSAALTWGRSVPEALVQSAPVAIFVARRATYRAGFDFRLGFLSIGWIVVGCAVVCGILLLFEPKRQDISRFFWLQCVLAIVVIALALLRLGPYPGVALAIVGGALLVWGAFERYR